MQRPGYHFLPLANWMNDPNGTIFWKGKYHVFYQHNPEGPFWGTMHWGHTVSEDLVHWKNLPLALSPTSSGPDNEGCWSGCAVINKGIPTIVYTGVRPEVQCIATSSDDMVTWHKYSGNPVLGGPPEGLEVDGFRDPCVWNENDRWCMILGSGMRGVRGATLLYESRDLINWRYIHPLCIGDGNVTGDMWECPDFFPLNKKHVLLVSTLGRTLYFIGRYHDNNFTTEARGTTDIGDSFYAGRTLTDGMGRRILFGWVKEDRDPISCKISGWAGLLSVPRILSLCNGSRLRIEPATELKSLRGRHQRYEDIRLAAGSSFPLDGLEGDALEISAEFSAEDAQQFGLKLRCSPDDSEKTFIAFDKDTRSLQLDTRFSSLDTNVGHGIHGGRMDLFEGNTLTMHIFIDRSVIEVFANSMTCLTGRIYPSRPDSIHMGLFARNGRSRLISLDAWEVRKDGSS